ncbi:OLC1v1024122C1 [Oldenlandia corymbosa var. corymbosa]|uniref:OLC1v1024122C1 n=1 Tax=Oldenlandia corymbosa var. corymbosa TaxID=529605 RepID=A0AAV1C3X5_OLDCO|nr:OLC1v1024122C1 [Oldenlandia corymbosa var. corymbosa]
MDSPPSRLGRLDSNSSNHDGKGLRSSSSLSKSISSSSSQSLSSILNNPHAGKSDYWWSSTSSIPAPEFAPLPLANSSAVPKPGSEVTKADFGPYIRSISEHYSRFHDIQQHESLEGQDGEFAGQGEALVACLREVPALYFKEDFKLEEGGTFKAACPFKTTAENLVLQEKLSQYLDTVELHLVKEISLRSSSFYEAQGQLEDLNTKIVEGCNRIRELKETIRLLDSGLIGSARRVQEVSLRRDNLVALRNKLKLIQYVNQALSTLNLLIASADCAGALDVTLDLQQLLDGDELTGLHCFRSLRDHVVAAVDSINNILSAEFLRVSLHEGREGASFESITRASAIMTGQDVQVELNEDEASNLRDRLLPVVIGLLRTARLPAVLRMYRDTLTADMKAAFKAAVSEWLPVLVASDIVQGERVVDTDGGGSRLGDKLRSLSPDCFLQLLSAIFVVVQAHLERASEVKKAIEWIMSNRDGHYAANTVAAAIAVGAAAVESSQETDGSAGNLLSYTSHGDGRENHASTPSNSSGNFRTDVLRENTEAVFAACDAAHHRWAKLLGVRANIHDKLRLQEFLSVYNLTQDFMNVTEKIGGRLGYSIRGILQSQAKTFVETQHESRMAKMRAILEQENWNEVDVPDEYQTILNSMFSSESSSSEHIDEPPVGSPASNGNPPVHTEASPGGDAGSLNLVEHAGQNESGQLSGDNRQRNSAENTAENGPSTAQNNDANRKERGKPSCRTLSFKGLQYHMVNCGLSLVKMLAEYIDMVNCLSMQSSEIGRRIVEILKFFNTRTAQLVLGAGAMQVSGLKSITSKHLALSSQVIGFVHAMIPEIRRVLFSKVPETRKVLLSSEIDRVTQDYKVHQEEIHSKLVQIMKERLLFNLRRLPQIVESWNGPEDSDPQPSQFALSVTKEVGVLQRALSRTLHQFEVETIFRQVVVIFHTQISQAYSSVDVSTPQAKSRLQRDVHHILRCIRSLPSGCSSESGPTNWGQLDEFFVQRFGTETDN